MLSVVIPYRNEDMLGFTLHRLRDTIKVEYEAICVDDGSNRYIRIPDPPRNTVQISNPEPIGNCFSRDRGIHLAKYDIVLVIDAHMNFWPNDWSEVMVQHIIDNPTHIGCPYSLQLAPDRMDMEDATGRYRGAHLVVKDVDSSGRRRILPCIWNAHIDEPGPIGCVLGGAYIFRKDWYIERLQSPWKHLRGWGHSEPTLSLINYLMGGENVLLDAEIGHMYRTGGDAPYASRVYNLTFNQLFLANVVVWDEDDILEMIEHMHLSNGADDAAAMLTLERSSYRQYKRYLRDNAPRSWWDYKREWMNPERNY